MREDSIEAADNNQEMPTAAQEDGFRVEEDDKEDRYT